MTPQQEADAALDYYRSLRGLPQERIEILIREYFAPPLVPELEYEITLRAMEMALND